MARLVHDVVYNVKTYHNLLQKHIDNLFLNIYIYFKKPGILPHTKKGPGEEVIGSSLGYAGSHEALHDEVLGQTEEKNILKCHLIP